MTMVYVLVAGWKNSNKNSHGIRHGPLVTYGPSSVWSTLKLARSQRDFSLRMTDNPFDFIKIFQLEINNGQTLATANRIANRGKKG